MAFARDQVRSEIEPVDRGERLRASPGLESAVSAGDVLAAQGTPSGQSAKRRRSRRPPQLCSPAALQFAHQLPRGSRRIRAARRCVVGVQRARRPMHYISVPVWRVDRTSATGSWPRGRRAQCRSSAVGPDRKDRRPSSARSSRFRIRSRIYIRIETSCRRLSCRRRQCPFGGDEVPRSPAQEPQVVGAVAQLAHHRPQAGGRAERRCEDVHEVDLEDGAGSRVERIQPSSVVFSMPRSVFRPSRRRILRGMQDNAGRQSRPRMGPARILLDFAIVPDR